MPRTPTNLSRGSPPQGWTSEVGETLVLRTAIPPLPSVTPDQKRAGSAFKMAADLLQDFLCANCGRKQRFMKLCTACRQEFYW